MVFTFWRLQFPLCMVASLGLFSLLKGVCLGFAYCWSHRVTSGCLLLMTCFLRILVLLTILPHLRFIYINSRKQTLSTGIFESNKLNENWWTCFFDISFQLPYFAILFQDEAIFCPYKLSNKSFVRYWLIGITKLEVCLMLYDFPQWGLRSDQSARTLNKFSLIATTSHKISKDRRSNESVIK